MSEFTIRFTDETDAGLEEVRTMLGLPNKGEVIRRALNLLNFLLHEKNLGGKLIIKNYSAGTEREIVTP